MRVFVVVLDSRPPVFKSAIVAEVETKKEGEKRSPKEVHSQAIMALETRLKERLKAFVKIKGNEKKGKISIAYENKEELEKISQKLLNG